MIDPWTTRPVRTDDAAVIARIERGSYAGVLAESDGVVVAGAGTVLLDWGPTRGEPTGLRARIVNVYTATDWRRRGTWRQGRSRARNTTLLPPRSIGPAAATSCR